MSHIAGKISFRLPESFAPEDYLRSTRLRPHCDDARYFVSTILTKTACGNVDDDGNVRLMANQTRSIMHNRECRSIVDSLLDGGVVERTGYTVGVKAFGYRLSNRFVSDRHGRVQATDRRLIRRLEVFHAEQEQERRSRMQPVHFALERHQRRLSIDMEQAGEILSRLPAASNPWDCQGVLVRDIQEKSFHLNVGTYGRVSNNISCMKRELRKSLRLENEELRNVDISCSQPVFLGKAAAIETGREAGSGIACNYDAQLFSGLYTTSTIDYKYINTIAYKEIEKFNELVQSGLLYEFLADRMSSRTGSVFTRDDVKKPFLRDVVAKRGNYQSDLEDVFSEHFPAVHRFIRRVNKDGAEHANLIRRLQRDESDLVIGNVAADIVTRRPDMFILTLHDSIFATSSDLPFVADAFESAFSRNGFPMNLKHG